ncbi:lysozyme family protein [Vagococcus entomophilus]|uniref:Uncharacterized protein n=1 Tax=Vagococcus entomophilus TaxID=1160095 RepID=A0A430AG84_9ENTE|nr:lysozyme family protein [Vagococcus entomophilus]RSU06901.1 hypothetical protein CBF30_06475 [Vagococcus entomophilus]
MENEKHRQENPKEIEAAKKSGENVLGSSVKMTKKVFMNKHQRLNKKPSIGYKGYSGKPKSLLKKKPLSIVQEKNPAQLIGGAKKSGQKQDLSNKVESLKRVVDNKAAEKVASLNPKTKKAVYAKKMLEMVINTIGRDANGSLNLIGLILSIVIIFSIVLATAPLLPIIVILAAIIAIFLAIWSFLVGLFTIKTENMALEEAYRLVTYMDAETNQNIHNLYQKYSLDQNVDQVKFTVNGFAANAEDFLYSTDGDKFLYYLNAKYEDYDIDNKVDKNNYFNVTTVRQEMQALHKEGFHYTDDGIKTEKVKETTTVYDPDTGKEETKEQIVEKKVATINVSITSLTQVVDEHPSIMTVDQRDKFFPIQDLPQFVNKIALGNPLGKNKYATVTEKYGYRGRNTDSWDNYVRIRATKGDPVYATAKEEVDEISGGTVENFGPQKLKVIYKNLTNIKVREGQNLNEGDLIGYTAINGIDMSIKENRTLHKDPNLYPSAYMDRLSYQFPGNDGTLLPGGGLTGDLIDPPASVSKWRDLAQKYCDQNNISKYVNLVLAIIWEESGGDSQKNPDIMQSSESAGHKITNPEESIQAGTKLLASLIKQGKDDQVLDIAVLQAYNYGSGFLDWLKEKNFKYSFETGKNYAAEKAKSKTIAYANPIAEKMGYSWRYAYGNMFYVKLVTQHITQETGELVNIAKKEVGMSNGSKYWEWFGYNGRIEWCQIFVSWVANQAGYDADGLILKTASCITEVDYLKKNARYKEAVSGYIPKSGDLIFFDWSGTRTGKDHVGIVEYSDGKTVQTIEGNSSDMVKRNTYNINDINISGYGNMSGGEG